jgi:hypothetical protein
MPATHTPCTRNQVAPNIAPVVTILGGPSQAFRVADGIKLVAALDPKSVCGGKRVRAQGASICMLLVAARLARTVRSCSASRGALP